MNFSKIDQKIIRVLKCAGSRYCSPVEIGQKVKGKSAGWARGRCFDLVGKGVLEVEKGCFRLKKA